LGFVGSHLVQKLVELGNEVSVIDITDPEETTNPHISFHKVDIRNLEQIKKLSQNIDYIFHTAALVPISKAEKFFDEVNAYGTRNILIAALENNVESVVYISSSAVYKIPKKGVIITEEYPIEPHTSYGEAKYHAEQICFEYMKKGLPVSIIRPRTILGTHRLGIYSILFDWILNNKKVFILGDGSNKFSYVSIPDLIESMILSAKKGGGEIFNISTDKYGTYRGDLEDLIEYAESKSTIVSVNASLCRIILKILDKWNLSPLAEWHYDTIDKEYVFDISKAKKLLGWHPQDSNKKMFHESYDWFRENYDSLNVGTTHKTKLNPKILDLVSKLS